MKLLKCNQEQIKDREEELLEFKAKYYNLINNLP